MLRAAINEGERPSSAFDGDRHFAQILEASPAFIWLLDPDGRVMVLNGPARRLAGEAPAAARAPWRNAWPEGSRFSIDRAVAAARDGGSFRFRSRYPVGEGPGLYLDTSVTPVRDEAGAVIRLLVVAQDVTAQVESAAFLNTVIDVLPLALTVKDVRTGRIVLANRAAEDLFEKPEGLVGLRVEDAAPSCLAAWALGDDIAAPGSRTILRRDDRGGVVRYLSAAKVATYDDEGARHLIGLTENVTQQQLDAEALRRALEQAEQANQAKTAFLTNMSHEIRTPLNGVIAGIDLMAARELDQDMGELVGMVRASADDLERRLKDLLAMSRLKAWEARLCAEPLEVADLLNDLVEAVRPQAEAKDLTVAVRIEPGMDAVLLGDVGCLEQALGRLMDNAVKFTERGGVTIDAGRLPDGRVRFRVSDTGIGFDAALKDQLFGSFRQQDPSLTRRFGGLGLGLTTALELARLMGGTMDAKPCPAGGASFWMDLPLPAAPRELEPAPDVGPDGETRTLRVLVADDHPTNRRIVELMLADIAEIVSVEDGEAAVEAMRVGSFDVVLMDIQMPVMDGITAVARIRADEAEAGTARTPVIMLTANTQEEYVTDSRRAGADRMVGKPFTAMVLMSAIQGVLHG